MFNDVCYIIQHRDISQNKDRTNNLINLIKYLKNISNDMEILVLEQTEYASVSLQSYLHLSNVRYIHLKNPGLFNRSWGFNCSVNLTTKSKLVFADNDMILRKESLINSIKILDDCDAIRPYNGYAKYLTELQTKNYFKTRSMPDIKDIEKLVYINNFSGGVILFNKESFKRIGMFDERFEGWGGEDDEMHIHLHNLHNSSKIKIITFDEPIIHLYHSRNVNDGNTQPNYNKNVSFINDGKRNDGINILGDITKYDKD